MSSHTFNPSPPSVWDRYLATNKRAVTSKHPLVRCPECKGFMLAFPGPHAPRWRHGVLVDCVGTVLR